MATICTGCQMRLANLLRAVPDLMRELNVTILKHSRTAAPSGPAGPADLDPVRMPFNIGAARARDELLDVLQAWAKLVSEERTTPALMFDRAGTRTVVRIPTPLTCKDNPTSISGWLLQYTDWLRRYAAAADCLSEIGDAVGRVERMIDTPPRLVYIGPCGAVYESGDGVHTTVCTADLYAKENADTVTCRDCDTEADVYQRRATNLRRARDILTDPETIARALRSNGVHVTVERIYKWRERGQLQPAGINKKTGRYLYRFGDVHALWERMEERNQLKGTK